VKCECGSTSITATVSDYVCTRCGLCLAPIFDAHNGHPTLEPLNPIGTVIDGRSRKWDRLKRFNGRRYHAGDKAYLALCRSCQDLGISDRFAQQALALYRHLWRRIHWRHPGPGLAPTCLWHVLQSRGIAITRRRIVESFHNSQVTQRSVFHALHRYEFPEVRR